MLETGINVNNEPGEVITEKGIKTIHNATLVERGGTCHHCCCLQHRGSVLTTSSHIEGNLHEGRLVLWPPPSK
jgi:hypothetical protein